ncbi:MAG: 3-phosphoshikimate 1-carboxyvinyltransferase [Clostridia bacterium]|nr:3-phosphoshikimate 1-carboxyvinyltransferase [Clostridia bacterium]
MNVVIKSSKGIGAVQAPPSKSMAHRLLIGAGLAKGISVIHNVAPSQDILATIDCLRSLGAVVTIDGDTVTVTGTDPKQRENATLPCRESGSTLRFMIPLCLLSNAPCTLTGTPRLMERPQTVYETLCREKGWLFQKSQAGITLCGQLQGGDFSLAGNISSQFITGLLYALPLTGQDSTITLTGVVESRSYIDLTLQALRTFGIDVDWKNEHTLHIKAGSYQPQDLTVENDYSNAAFLDAFTLLGGNVTVTGLDPQSLQGDKIYKKDFASLRAGCPTLSLKDCPDLGPIYMAMGAALNGCLLTDTARLKIKESDRGIAMAEELAKFGVSVTVEDNCITVNSSPLQRPASPLYGHNDHRIVMSLVALCTLTGGEIRGAEAVAKSFPDYFERIKQLGISWKEVESHGSE